MKPTTTSQSYSASSTASIESGGQHIRSAFGQDKSPTAPEMAAALSGIFEMHLAVVTSDGAPLVAPIDGIFYKG